jgi:energy-coupling factor transporter transmembrane protein EcfT
MKANVDTAIAAFLLLITIVFLVQRRVGYLAVWLLLITIVIGYGVRMPLTLAVTLGIATVAVVVLISGQALKEGYENPNESEDKKKDEPKPHSSSKGDKAEDNNMDAHIDAGTTILHAFQKLNPEQVLQMRDDTKELMETQQQLMETLSSLGPQVKQGAELVKSFQGMFGGNLTEVLKQ